MKQPAVEIRDLTVELGGRKVLKNISLDIQKNSVTALIGPNGAGKTTLFKAMLGLVEYTGRVKFCRNGNSKARIGYIPQNIDIEKENPIRLVDFLLLTEQRVPMWIRPLPSRRKKALEAMERVGVAKLSRQPIGKLSGGELQRSMLAKVILSRPDVVLMDEPVSGIDVTGGELFCELLEDLKKEHRFTLVLTSHDLSVVSNHATEVLCINRTLKCEGPPVEVLTPDTLQELYGPHTGLVRHHDHYKNGRHSARL